MGPIFLLEKNKIRTITASPNGTVTVVFSEKVFVVITGTGSMQLFFKAETNKTH